MLESCIGIYLHGFKYYLKHEKECFIIFKMRGATERFRYMIKREFECFK